MNPILMAIILVTVIGLIGAVILVAASIFMYVPVDERVEKITGVLAGANCGACGCAGCADYAKSIVEDGNAINKCTPGGAKSVAAIAEIMGVEATASEPMKAVVTCSGTCDKTSKRYEFDGIHSCQAVKGLYGGDGLCKFGWPGLRRLHPGLRLRRHPHRGRHRQGGPGEVHRLRRLRRSLPQQCDLHHP